MYKAEHEVKPMINGNLKPTVNVVKLWSCAQEEGKDVFDIEKHLNSESLEDNLKAHFFLVSASLQDILGRFIIQMDDFNYERTHRGISMFDRLKMFAKQNKIVVDHPLQALVAPLELMRLLQFQAFPHQNHSFILIVYDPSLKSNNKVDSNLRVDSQMFKELLPRQWALFN